MFTICESKQYQKTIFEVEEENKFRIYRLCIPLRKGVSRLFTYQAAFSVIKKKIAKNYSNAKLIHCHALFPLIKLANEISQQHSIILYATEHHTVYTEDYLRGNKKFIVNYNKYYGRKIYKTSVVSIYLKKLMVNYGFKRLTHIPNPVDSDIFFYTSHKRGRPYRFLHVSSLDQEAKNIEGIIKAFKMVSDKKIEFSLTIVGSNPKRRLDIEEYILQEGLDHKVTLLENLYQMQIADLMRASDMFVLFSNYETFSCVVAEAQCCGLPSIVTNIGGPTEIINSKDLGVVIEKGNLNQLRNVIITCIEKLKFNREDISTKGMSRYHKTIFLEKIDHFYN